MATNNAINANSVTPLPIANGGTGVNTTPTTASSSTFAAWNANSNLPANNHLSGYTTTATAAGTTALTVGSTYQQFFTGSTTQTVTMPVTSTLVLGQSWLIVNNSSGVVTVQSSGGNTIVAMGPGTDAVITCILTSGTSAASWNSDYSTNTVGVASIAGTANQIVASAATGAVTLSTPQNIGTASAVQFGSLTFGGSVLSVYTANTAWTPVFTFATPGNLSVAYTAQVGSYSRIGSLITASWSLLFTPTFTTSSGAMSITGLPFAASSSNSYGTIVTSGFTYGGSNTHITAIVAGTSSSIIIQSSGSGAAIVNIGATNFTSGNLVTLSGTVNYLI